MQPTEHLVVTCFAFVHSVDHPLRIARPFIYEIDSGVMLWQPFRRTISKMEDSNKDTYLKAFNMLFLLG